MRKSPKEDQTPRLPLSQFHRVFRFCFLNVIFAHVIAYDLATSFVIGPVTVWCNNRILKKLSNIGSVWDAPWGLQQWRSYDLAVKGRNPDKFRRNLGMLC